jgi:hypothetical protein
MIINSNMVKSGRGNSGPEQSWNVQVCAELLERGGVDLLNDRDSLLISPMDNALQANHKAVLEVIMNPRPFTPIL